MEVEEGEQPAVLEIYFYLDGLQIAGVNHTNGVVI